MMLAVPKELSKDIELLIADCFCHGKHGNSQKRHKHG
jgi:hypothetical protein